MAPRIRPAVTELHEHTSASSIRSPFAGPASSSVSGVSVSRPPTIDRNATYPVASPTRTPPSRFVASSEITSFLYTPDTGSA